MKTYTPVTLDITRPSFPALIDAVQNDSDTRYIVVTITDKGVEWPIPEDAHGIVSISKPDGKPCLYDVMPDGAPAVAFEGSTATFAIAPQALTVAGDAYGSLSLYNAAGERLTTFAFMLKIARTAVPDDTVTSTPYYSILTRQIAAVLDAVQRTVDLTAAATALPYGSAPTVDKETTEDNQIKLTFGIPEGAPGPQGPVGRGLIVQGKYDTLTELEETITSPEPGDAYGVGFQAPYDIYIWDAVHGWVDHGQIQGPDGYSPTITPNSANTDTDYRLDVTDVNGTYGTPNLIGPQGPQGIQGEQGIQGIQGATGPQGIQGDTGPQGIQGKTGPRGYTFTPAVSADGELSWTNDGGLTNPTPVNVTGPQGEQGIQGPQGIQGIQGATGPQGPKGDTGEGLTVLGYYATLEALEADVTAPEAGDAYGVGAAAPYDIYIYDGVTLAWVNNGPLQGAQGEPGPNEITADTATTLDGLLKGDGSTITVAVPGEDYAAAQHAPTHATDGTDPVTPGMIGALEYADLSGREASGTFPSFDGVFEGTELDHVVLYGKSTQDGTPSPEAPVDIASYEPGEVWAGGPNLFRGIGVPDTGDGYYLGYNMQPTTDGFARCYLDNSSGTTTSFQIAQIPISQMPSVEAGATYKVLTEFRNVANVPSTFYVSAPYSTDAGNLAFSNVKIPATDVKEGAVIINDVSVVENLEELTNGYWFTIINIPAGTTCDFEARISIYSANYEATEYVPYTGSTYPLTLTLPGIPVDSGGNYTDETGQQYIADTYDVVTGEYVQRVKRLVLDGTETTAAYNWTAATDVQQINVSTAADAKSNYVSLCTHFPLNLKAGNPGNNESGHYVVIAGTTSPKNQFVFAIPKAILAEYGFDNTDNSTAISTAPAAAQAYFAAQYAAGTPVTVDYALAEPIVTYLDPTQIPAYAPITNISAGGGYISANLGQAMAPVQTTPQTLTAQQQQQVLTNLGLAANDETGIVTWAALAAAYTEGVNQA